MSKTVVGLFASTAEAEKVKQTLIADGYDAQNIRVVNNQEGETSTSTGSTTSDRDYSATASDKDYTDIGSGGGTGIGEKISSFFRNLSGGDETAHHHYATGVNQGGALLTATVDDAEAAQVASTLREYGARDIQGENRSTTGQNTAGYAGRETAANLSGGNSDLPGDRSNLSGERSNLSGETAIPVVEEELVVGKREVDRGGVRIYSHVVERPVEAEVTLHNETVNVERRAVNRPATAADFGTGDASFELRATGEEAVIGKNSRVVEEVMIGKQATENTEAIHDTVRKTEVEVEQIPGQLTQEKR